jgi:hypothetical protein
MAEELAVSRELVAKIRRQLIESRQIPNLPGRVGADGKLYTSAGLPRETAEKPPKELPPPPEEVTEKGRRGMGAATVEAPAGKAPTRTADVSFPDGPSPKSTAAAYPTEINSATIDEMLDLMTKQIMQVITWTQAEGFLDAYKNASPNARGLFHTAAIKLAARADQLRRG